MTLLFCCDENRRDLVRAHPTINGIDLLEVLDEPSQPLADRQRFLQLRLLKPPAAPLTTANIRIEGGELVRDIRAVQLSGSGTDFTIEVDRAGDFSIYTLRLVAGDTTDDPPPTFDPPLSAIDFSFKVNCTTEFDCVSEPCPPPVFSEPTLDYLARDFTSIRQMMIDRIRVLSPDWREDHLADLMHTLIDLKAYVADYQHYQLDAINTEAYLFTARSRVSVRRHARLIDYRMHDGCTARVWAHLTIDPAVTSGVVLPRGTQLLTGIPGLPTAIAPDTPAHREALRGDGEVFETLHDATLWSEHNALSFYTWGDGRCVLPAGATQATLRGQFPSLQPGDVLVLEEVRGPRTGDTADADPAKRVAVRLVGTDATQRDALTDTDITAIRWHPDDALPFALCLSATGPTGSTEISVARGNIVLADHGRSVPPDALGSVPASTLAYVSTHSQCEPTELEAVPPRFRPRLRHSPVAQVLPYHAADARAQAASAATQLSPASALPALTLTHTEDGSGLEWTPQRDLLTSEADEPAFVLEVESDGTARIRFGDDVHGKRPNTGETFFAHYRIGAPTAGTIGHDALAHIITPLTDIIAVRNPLPGTGGTPPETIEDVRQNAPQAFRTQKRAVTPADYEAVALLFPGVQRAAATIRWTGSWYTVFLTIDRVGGRAIDQPFEAALRHHINTYRMMGYDIEIDGPAYVSLEIDMQVCVAPGYFRAAVRQSLEAVFSARILPNGTQGIFHPDNFTFGQPVYLSRLYAAASAVAGVQSVNITRFQKQDQPATSALESGKLVLGRLEIARLEQNPNFPKRGVFRLVLQGGN